MKAGYKVVSGPFFKEDKFILVSNYHNTNKVYNLPYHDKTKTLKCEIGVWKLKTIKK